MNVMIADDHPLFVEGLVNLLKAEEFIEIVAVVNNGKQAVKKALENKPDVILMDIGMPKLNGIEATRKIKNKLENIKIIILTSFEQEDSLFNAIKAGASGYLLKSLDGDELIRSLSDIKEGKNPFSAGLEDSLLNKIQTRSKDNKKNKKLTERQIEVLKLLVKGLTYKEIGEKLFISERTIKYHMEKIKERLSLNTQAQVIAYAKENIETEK